MSINRKYESYYRILRRAISYMEEYLSTGPTNTAYRNNRMERCKEEIDIAMKQLTKLL